MRCVQLRATHFDCQKATQKTGQKYRNTDRDIEIYIYKLDCTPLSYSRPQGEENELQHWTLTLVIVIVPVIISIIKTIEY